MKLICFPHYTCGGLLCDILNNTFSPIGTHGGIDSIAHSIGKIGDTDTVNTTFDPLVLKNKLSAIDTNLWAGTHCWPGNMQPLDQFEQILTITTATWKSKLYRWTRSYHHYYASRWSNLSNMSLTDKMRETAKNYHVAFEPVIASNVVNIEFADIVENTHEFKYIVKNYSVDQHMDRWRTVNNFLYADIWNLASTHAFHQAEVEINLQRYYRYDLN